MGWCSLHNLLAQAAESSDRATATQSLLIMFIVVGTVLLVFLGVVVLLARSNRRHQQPKPPAATDPSIDAWQAAGDRAEAPARRDEPSSE